MNWLLSILMLFVAQNSDNTTTSIPNKTGKVYGTITAKEDGRLLSDATITAQSMNSEFSQTTTTDETGRYEFDALPYGIYTLIATYDGKQAEEELALNGLTPLKEKNIVIDITEELSREELRAELEEEIARELAEEERRIALREAEEKRAEAERAEEQRKEEEAREAAMMEARMPEEGRSREIDEARIRAELEAEVSANLGAAPTRGNNTNEVPLVGFVPSPPVEETARAEEGPIVKEETKTDLINTKDEAISTFSIDVDKASYSLVRSHINNGFSLPKENIRVEELINYFTYDYDSPKDEERFATYTAISDCPWNEKSNIVHIGLQGKKLDFSESPASNLTFLLDVSGSMSDDIALVKSSLEMVVEHMRPEDKIAIVVYAGAAGLVLPSTSGDQKETILNALNNLRTGGSTAGGAGIKLAYQIAQDNFVEGGNNRVILATDGDFNVGVSSDQGLEELIVEEREKGVFLTALGFGYGNYQDTKMETLANKGNGNYAYIDNIKEANKVLVQEMSGTLYTIAKDVKIQVEFNPQVVKSYRLIGYENRRLENQDFEDDTKDAGELGAGHTVTAIYEVFYHNKETLTSDNEVLDLRLRYKEPDGDESKLLETKVTYDYKPLDKSDENIRWSAALASWGLVLREEDYVKRMSAEDVYRLADSAVGEDLEGERAECLQLIGNWSENAAQLEEASHHHED